MKFKTSRCTSAVITIEGIKVKAKNIPKRILISRWEKLTSQPFPKVKAFQLANEDFDRVMCLRRCDEDELRELQEWNTILTNEGTDACVFNADESAGFDYIILVREKPYHNIKIIFDHELSHIARGDL